MKVKLVYNSLLLTLRNEDDKPQSTHKQVILRFKHYDKANDE